ncbi:MAG TPA: Gldg family protein, partial [Spirochaetia bacterium]
GEPGKSLQHDYDSLQTGLSRDYSLHEYLPGEEIPPEVDVLLVIGGAGWSADQVRPIDTYVMNGGKVLFATKGLDVTTARTFSASTVPSSPLLSMIESYGVRVGRDMVLDTASRDYRLPQQRPTGEIAWETIGRYPPWVSVQGPNVAVSHPITARFTGLDLLWPSPLTAVPRDGVEETPLLTSSASSWLQEPPFVIDPYKVPQSGTGTARFTLAYALSGTFPSAFAGAGGAGGADTPTRSKPTRMLVVGDSDFASDLMQFSDSVANVFFIENGILWLSGNADLLSIKTRAGAEGKLDRIQDPATRSAIMVGAPILNVVVIPLAVLVVGIVIRLRRRERGQS